MRPNIVNLELEDLPDTHTATEKYIERLETAMPSRQHSDLVMPPGKTGG